MLALAINEHGEVLDVLLQKTRCKKAAKRCLQRLLDEQGIPEQIVTDGKVTVLPSARRPSWEVRCTLRFQQLSVITT